MITTELSQLEVDERFRALIVQTEEAKSIASFVLPDGDNVGPYKQWIIEWTGLHDDDVDVVNVADGEQLPNPADYDLIIGTGSGHMPSENTRWMQETVLFKRAADEAQIVQYDICFMHQLRTLAQGGETEELSLGPRFGVGEITLTPEGRRHPLYDGLPDSFVIFQSNSVIVSRPGSINGFQAVELATSDYRNEALQTGPYGMSGQHHAEGRPDIWEALAIKKREGGKKRTPGGLLVPDKSGQLITPSDEHFAEIVKRLNTDGLQAQANGQRIGRNLVKIAGARRLELARG